MQRLPEFDGAMRNKLEEAERAGEVLRYVGVIETEASGGGRARASVELKRYSRAHSFARIQGSDNIIAFRTQRYHQQPLIVQGPGAGPEVTAGGVFGDLLRLAAYVGAPS